MSEAVSETVSDAPVPGMKRGRGRPPGSRNKVGRSAKELLDLHGKGAIETLCAVAAGHVVYGPPDDAGKRQKIMPTLDQRISAAKTVLDRLVPTLKASEVSAAVTTTSTDTHDQTTLAAVLLNVLHAGRASEPSSLPAEGFAIPPVPQSPGYPETPPVARPDPETLLLNGNDAPEPAPEPKAEPRDPSLPVFRPVVEELDETSKISLALLQRARRLRGD